MTSILNMDRMGAVTTQMYAKFHAYQDSDADFFIHMDSDTIFKEPITRLDFLDDRNRVYVKRVRFDALEKTYRVWQKPAEQLFKEPVIYETMIGFPFVFPRHLYSNAIHLIETRHNKSFIQAARSVENFIEFTTLGHYLVTYLSNDRWIDNDNKSNKVIQSWSWGKFTPDRVAWYECILRANHSNQCHLQPQNQKAAPQPSCACAPQSIMISGIVIILAHLLLVDYPHHTRIRSVTISIRT